MKGNELKFKTVLKLQHKYMHTIFVKYKKTNKIINNYFIYSMSTLLKLLHSLKKFYIIIL